MKTLTLALISATALAVVGITPSYAGEETALEIRADYQGVGATVSAVEPITIESFNINDRNDPKCIYQHYTLTGGSDEDLSNLQGLLMALGAQSGMGGNTDARSVWFSNYEADIINDPTSTAKFKIEKSKFNLQVGDVFHFGPDDIGLGSIISAAKNGSNPTALLSSTCGNRVMKINVKTSDDVVSYKFNW
jgi:hypothetical protein